MRSIMEAPPKKSIRKKTSKKKAYTAWWRWTFKLWKIFFLVQLILRIWYNSWLEIANLREFALTGLFAHGEQIR